MSSQIFDLLDVLATKLAGLINIFWQMNLLMLSELALKDKRFATLITYMHPGGLIMAPLMINEGLVVSNF